MRAGPALVVENNGTKDYTPGWIFIALCAIIGMVAACFIRTTAQTQPPRAQQTGNAFNS
jgi:hypothetical protein